VNGEKGSLGSIILYTSLVYGFGYYPANTLVWSGWCDRSSTNQYPCNSNSGTLILILCQKHQQKFYG